MDNINQRQFTSGEVVKAAGIAMGAFQNWLNRGVLIGPDPIKGGGTPGRYRSFTWFTLNEVAMAAAIVKAGVNDVQTAFRAAQSYAHAGNGALPGTPARDPSLPFAVEHGRTLLAFNGERAGVFLYKPSEDILPHIRQSLGRPEGFTVIDALDVFDRVCGSIGIHPQEVLDRAYSESNA
ncbi:hypothetical protein [Salipiger sp. PrR003]|uniref:hypothetical protein n=1 Tax=Salipiger sp. PrR003 TaxID=2706776 RepID=UPI0013DABEF2|nr:hypothetical protein [Salipiger sp. PrR003]NDV52152.1 hypothetical protein [Salipiger sp. PrR003]NDV52178.1 hypothetical protein [Salipiger sp. PrR003]